MFSFSPIPVCKQLSLWLVVIQKLNKFLNSTKQVWQSLPHLRPFSCIYAVWDIPRLYSYKDSKDCHPQGNSGAECLLMWTPTLDFLSRVIYDTAFQTSIRGNLFCRSISVWTGRKDPLCLLPQTLNSLVSLKSIPTVHQSGMASHPPSPQTGLMLYKHSIVQCLQLFQHSVWSQLYSITAKKKKEICFKRARA